MKISLKKTFASWLPMLFLLLTGGSLLFVFFRKELLYFIFFLFLTLLSLKHIYKRELINFVEMVGLFVSLLVINFLFADSAQSTQKLLANIIIFSSSILSALYYSREENKTLFVQHLYFILKIILFHSLINFFIYPFVKPFLFELTNNRYDCMSFLNIFFYLQGTHSLSILGVEVVRNQGIFWEPGVLQIFLNLQLFILAFVYNRKGLIFWLTILGVITTFSTTGLVVMFIQLVMSFITEIRKNVIFLPFAFLFIVMLYFITSANISEKISGDGQFSFQVRFFDLVQPLYMAYENPFTGVGLDDEQFTSLRSSTAYSLNLDYVSFSNVNNKGSTNSIMFFLAAAGIPFTILILAMLYQQQFILEKRNWFFIFIIISLMTEPIMLRPFFLTFVMSGGIHLFNKFTWKTY